MLGVMARRDRLILALAGLLVLPSVLFTAANLLKHGLGIEWLADALGQLAEPGDIMTTGHTALVLGGPVLALLLVLPSVVRFRAGRSPDVVEATVALRLRWAHLAVAGVALTVLAILFAYLIVENGDCWFGPTVAC